MKKILVLVGTLVCVLALDFSACTSRLIPPSEEYLLPPEPEKVEYIAKPPSELAKRLFSAGVSEQSREATWSDAQGKWVVWVGNVHHVEPQLKPSRIIFLDEYETSSMSFDSGQFTVTVNFGPADPAWTQQVKQLTTDEFVYYRAKLVKYNLGLGSNLLTLEDGQIIHCDDIAAKLVDLAYASYDQMQRLIEDAKSIATIKNYYEHKLEKGKAWIAAKTIVELTSGIELRDENWLQGMSSLPDKEKLKQSLQSETEQHIQTALIFLHLHPDISYHQELFEDLEQRLETNMGIVKRIQETANDLTSFYEEERHLSEPSISDLTLKLVLLKFPKILRLAKTLVEGFVESGELNTYEIIVGTCYDNLAYIDQNMMGISTNVVEGANKIVK